MNPEVAEAIPTLVERGVLRAEDGAVQLRVARGELLSVRGELRALWWLGVTLVMAGVGVLIAEKAQQLGPLVITLGLTVAAAGCLAWVIHRGPPFSWGQGESEAVAFDYVLLLGASLLASDLAYVEFRFKPLGVGWPWHLLVGSLVMAGLAVRYDSRLLFSLALSTFAAWRGVTASTFVSFAWFTTSAATVRTNAIGCGVLFVGLGMLLQRVNRKAHFEPVAAHLGWSLVLGAMTQGAIASSRSAADWLPWSLALLATAAGLAALAWRNRRFTLLLLAVLALYVAISRIVLVPVDDEKLAVAYFLVSGALTVIALLTAHRVLRRSGDA
ncbi:MAG TPA: hypothetical protein PKL08_07780 [Thermoanaerobaculaceae bacterium]|nr:hypothetical protein [Thermoanaerobaculaceae bacterium]